MAAFQKAEQWCRKRLPFRNCATGRAPGLLPPGSGGYLTSWAQFSHAQMGAVTLPWGLKVCLEASCNDRWKCLACASLCGLKTSQGTFLLFSWCHRLWGGGGVLGRWTVMPWAVLAELGQLLPWNMAMGWLRAWHTEVTNFAFGVRWTWVDCIIIYSRIRCDLGQMLQRSLNATQREFAPLS